MSRRAAADARVARQRRARRAAARRRRPDGGEGARGGSHRLRERGRRYGVGKFWPRSFYNLEYKREDVPICERAFVAMRKRKIRINPQIDAWAGNVRRLVTPDSVVWDVFNHAHLKFDDRKSSAGAVELLLRNVAL